MGMRTLTAAVVLALMLTAGVYAEESRFKDLAAIPELETLRAYSTALKHDRDGKEGELATQRAYARRLEEEIARLDIQLGITQRSLAVCATNGGH